MATSSNRQTYIRFYTDYPNTYFDKSEEIIEGSLHLEQTLIEGSLQFGVPCADMFECDLRNDFTVARKTTIWVYQIIDNDTANPKGLFFGKVDSMKMDALGYTNHLIAYDRFYFRRNKSVRKWWRKYWKDDTNNFTVKGIRNALLTKYGFTYDNVTMLNDNRVIYEPSEFKQLTFGELLTQLCAINACIPHIDETGRVKFIRLSNTVDHYITADIVETENCEFEYYDTPIIDGVSVENTEMTISSDEDDEDDAENVFPFPYNIFFEGKKEASMLKRANELLNAIKHITYRPCSVKMIQSDYDIKLGERLQITVSRNDTPVTYYAYVFKNDFSGTLLIEQTVSCDGDADFEVTTALGLASQVNASNEITTFEATITIISAEEDVITITDDGGEELGIVSFESGETSGEITLTLNSPGQTLTFESNIYEKSKDQFISGDDTIEFGPFDSDNFLVDDDTDPLGDGSNQNIVLPYIRYTIDTNRHVINLHGFHEANIRADNPEDVYVPDKVITKVGTVFNCCITS